MSTDAWSSAHSSEWGTVGLEGKQPVLCKKPDLVNHPDHYTKGGIECIDAIQSAIAGLPASYAWCTGQIIKYLWRWYWKNGIEDLKKADFYLKWLIERYQKENN